MMKAPVKKNSREDSHQSSNKKAATLYTVAFLDPRGQNPRDEYLLGFLSFGDKHY
jgi:hypothetical protein